MSIDNLIVRVMDLPVRVRAFTSYDDGVYNMYLNARHSYEALLSAYDHEMSHIQNNDFEGELNVDRVENKMHR